MKKVLVIAGTPVDTKAGAELVTKSKLSNEIQVLEKYISETPNEQTYFQTMEQEERMFKMEELFESYLAQGVDIFFVYCNSLSASVDFDLLASMYQKTIITPFTIYKELAQNRNKLGLLAANAQGAAGVERLMTQINPQIRISAISNLAWVYAVEEEVPAAQLVNAYGLPASIEFFKENAVEEVIFACTHFPYFFEDYQKKTDLKCLNVGTLMLEKLEQEL
ncbi:glutamate racemase [Streptococcaceae bacterium ESL0729]|nr:glutamate racemase [Streptococcaceae bacterium ESL0729]